MYDCENTPVLLEALDGQDIVDIAAGSTHCLALSRDGVVYQWGAKQSFEPKPVTHLNGEGVTSVCAGNGFSGAITDEGALYMWGKGFHGQLGQMVKFYGSYETTPVRVSIDGFAVRSIAMGSRHCVALAEAAA